MQLYLIIAVFIFTLLVVGVGLFLALATRQPRTFPQSANANKHPQGYWMGIGIAGGMLFGYVLALIVGMLEDDMSSFIIFGPGVGSLFGIAIGTALEQKYKDELRPLTLEEQQMRKWATIGGGILVVIGLLTLVAVILFAQ